MKTDSFGMPIQPWRDEVGAWEQYHAKRAARPSLHLFIPSPFKPRECVICGRRESAHTS